MKAEFESFGKRMSALVEALQDEIRDAVEAEEAGARFEEDLWTRPGGGGGRSRVLEDGRVFERAGVNVSTVHGLLEEKFARKLQGEGREFFAAGISLIFHPVSPWIPTVHANFRFIAQGDKAWFGGGADLTPYYLFEEDVRHFHRTLKAACDPHGETLYERFKATCDDYFYLPHRGEHRGVGGLFFENLELPLEAQFALVTDCAAQFLPAYLPLVRRHAAKPWTEAQKRWQEIRRGRYVEFNLLYDRGTKFGLETGGRTESILISMPPHARWAYAHAPEPGSPEAALLEVLRTPRAWV